MGPSHSSPLVQAVLDLQRLLAGSEPSTAQTPDSTKSCGGQMGAPETLLVLGDHFGDLLQAAEDCIRVKLAAAFPETPGLPWARLEG